jgi:hypothetical protein
VIPLLEGLSPALTKFLFKVYFLATKTQHNPIAESGVNTIQMVRKLLQINLLEKRWITLHMQ